MNINQGFVIDLLQFVVPLIILVLMIFFDILVIVVQGIFLFLLMIFILALYVDHFCPRMQLLEFIILVVLGILTVLVLHLIHLLIHFDLFFIVVQVIFATLVVFVDLFLLEELIAFLEEVEAIDLLFELLDGVDFQQVVWPMILQQA